VRLKVHFEFGICREICVPAEAEHELMIPATTTGVPAGITTALTGVPARAGAGSDAGLPSLASAEAKLSGEKPVLRLAARFPRGLAGADAFVEAPDGIYLPLPQRVGDDGKTLARFEIDLSGGADADELKGKLLTITLVSDAGATEAAWIVP
jgi:DsbC/DsbD-like thiol-disulfide interchange protein